MVASVQRRGWSSGSSSSSQPVASRPARPAWRGPRRARRRSGRRCCARRRRARGRRASPCATPSSARPGGARRAPRRSRPPGVADRVRAGRRRSGTTTWIPRDPVVMANGSSPRSRAARRAPARRPRTASNSRRRPAGRGRRPSGRGGRDGRTARPSVRRDAVLVRQPDERRRLAADARGRPRRPASGTRTRRTHVGRARGISCCTILVLLDPAVPAPQVERPVADVRDHRRRHGRVVGGEVGLRDPVGGEQHLVGMREAHVPPARAHHGLRGRHAQRSTGCARRPAPRSPATRAGGGTFEPPRSRRARLQRRRGQPPGIGVAPAAPAADHAGMTETASRTARVTAEPPAEPAEAVAHFAARLAFECDPADVAADLRDGAPGFVLTRLPQPCRVRPRAPARRRQPPARRDRRRGARRHPRGDAARHLLLGPGLQRRDARRAPGGRARASGEGDDRRLRVLGPGGAAARGRAAASYARDASGLVGL